MPLCAALMTDPKPNHDESVRQANKRLKDKIGEKRKEKGQTVLLG